MIFRRIALCAALMSPLLASAQWPEYVRTVGNVTTNDEVVFADNSGRLIRAYPGVRNYLNSPTNGGVYGYVIMYGQDGKPAWMPIPVQNPIVSITTNLEWSSELDGGTWDYVTNQAAAWGGRLPTSAELSAKILTAPGWIGEWYWSGTQGDPGNADLVIYADGSIVSVPKEGEYFARAVRDVIVTNTFFQALETHATMTTNAHGGIMRAASNHGSAGQVLHINHTTGRPYWATPASEGGIQYLVTSGVARVNARLATTNYTVAVENGTWDGNTAILSSTGTLTITASQPIGRWEYSREDADGIGLVDLVDTGTWETNAHGLITVGDIYGARISAYPDTNLPPMTGYATQIAISNLAVWAWETPSLVGTSNNMEGIFVAVDDPGTSELAPINLRTMQSSIASATASIIPANWSSYSADGTVNTSGGVDMAGKRLYLDNQWSLLGNGRYCALSYNGKDIFYVTMSNLLLEVTSFNPASMISINVSTSGVTSKPWIEWTSDLIAGNWMAITNSTSTYPAITNGTYWMTFSNVWNGAYFRAVQASSNANSLVVTIPVDVQGGLKLGGVTRTNWPTPVPGPQGIPGSNVIVYVGAEVGPEGPAGRDGRDGRDGLPGQDGVIGRDGLPGLSPTISVTNTLTGDAACTNVGTSTNVVLQFTLPPGPQGPAGPGMTNMPAVWDADSIGTNRLYYKIGGVTVGYFDTNGLTLLQGSLTLNEEDLTCNVRIYDGSRLVPSITLAGHPDTIGLYGRGIDGSYGLGWSHAGVDVGVVCASGIRLLNTNAAFYGRFVGDLSSIVSNYTGTFQGNFTGSVTGNLAGAYGYKEPIFTNFTANPILNSLIITNGGTFRMLNTNGVESFIIHPTNTYYTGIKTQYTRNAANTAAVTNIITIKSGLISGWLP
jgi:hypothetical protein